MNVQEPPCTIFPTLKRVGNRIAGERGIQIAKEQSEFMQKYNILLWQIMGENDSSGTLQVHVLLTHNDFSASGHLKSHQQVGTFSRAPHHTILYTLRLQMLSCILVGGNFFQIVELDCPLKYKEGNILWVRRCNYNNCFSIHLVP